MYYLCSLCPFAHNIMEEIWKPTSFSDKYEVSNHGQIRKKDTQRTRSLTVKNGRQYTNFVLNGKDFQCNIAREVLTTFVRPPRANEHALHISDKLTDDHLSNLKWGEGATRKPSSTTAVIVTEESTRKKFRFDSPKEAGAYIGKSKTAIFHNFGKEFVNGFKVERESPKPVKKDCVAPGPEEVVKEIKFGDHVVQVTDGGKVRVDKEGPWRKPEVLDRGYVRITFQFDKDGNTKRNSDRKVLSTKHDLHRLVCEAFHGPPPPGKGDADHVDENRLNNHPDNLVWVSRSENMNKTYREGHNVAANKNATYKYNIGGEYTGDVYDSSSDAARSVDGSLSAISLCCDGKKVSHKGFEWSHDAPPVYTGKRPDMQAKARAFNKEIGRKNREKKGPVKPPGKPIYVYDKDTLELKGEYLSQKAASADTGCNTANISKCASGGLKWTGGYIFSRKDPEAFRADREN